MAEMTNDKDTKPNPDPTVATNDAVARAVRAERDYTDGQVALTEAKIEGAVSVYEERLRAIDKATELLSQNVRGVLTNETLNRVMQAERDYTNGKIDNTLVRIEAMDKATELLSATVNRVPTEVTKEITHLKGLMSEQFESIDKQFQERDTRSERESRDNKVAVDAAFAAQKEAAAKQDEANAKAIDKSEKATAETIKTNSELARTTNDALAGNIADLKERIGRVEATKQGAADQRTETRSTLGLGQVVVGGIVAVIAAIALFVSFNHSSTPITQCKDVKTGIVVPC